MFGIFVYFVTLTLLRSHSCEKATSRTVSTEVDWFLDWFPQSCMLHFITDGRNQNFEIHINKNELGKQSPISLDVVTFSYTFPSVTSNTVSFRFYQTRLSETSCTVATFFIDGKADTYFRQAQLAGVLRYLQNDAYLDENPKYVLMVFERGDSNKFIETIFFSSLQLIHTTSKYFAISDEDPSIKTICLHCSYKSEMLYDVGMIGTLSQANEIWNNIHKNLSGVIVTAKRHWFLKYLDGGILDCSRPKLDKNFHALLEMCIIQWISEYLNFKASSDKARELRKANKVFGNMVNALNHTDQAFEIIPHEIDYWQVMMLYKKYNRTKSGNRISFTEHAWTFRPVTFVLVLNKDNLNQSVLFRPYDLTSWILTVIAIFVVSFILAISSLVHQGLRKPKSKDIADTSLQGLETLNKMILLTIGQIVEQNPTEKDVKKNNAESFRILFGLWLLVSLVLGNGYTGTIVSFLCSTVLPSKMPQNLEEVIRHSYTSISADTVYVAQSKKYRHYVNALIEEYKNEIGESAIATVYGEVDNSTVYISNVSHAQLLYLYDKGIPIPAALSSLSKVFVIPPNFVYVSVADLVDRFSKLMKSNTNVMLWHPPAGSEIISVKSTFALPRNYFFVLFKRYASFIEEAGFPSIWTKKTNDYQYKLGMKNYACYEDGHHDSVWKTSKCWNRPLDKNNPPPGDMIKYKGEDTSTRALSVKALVSTFYLLLYGIPIAGIGFFMEIICSNSYLCHCPTKRDACDRPKNSATQLLSTLVNDKKPRRCHFSEKKVIHKVRTDNVFQIPGTVM